MLLVPRRAGNLPFNDCSSVLGISLAWFTPAGRFITEMAFIYFYDTGREYISQVTWYCLLFITAASLMEMHFFLGPQTDFDGLDEHPVRVELDPCVRVSAKRLSGNRFIQWNEIFLTALQWVSDATWVAHKDCALSMVVWFFGFSLEGNGESRDAIIGGLRVHFGRSPVALMGDTRRSCAEAPQVMEVDFM